MGWEAIEDKVAKVVTLVTKLKKELEFANEEIEKLKEENIKLKEKLK